eukprot:5319000-Ditylum_brightwellii.AAC.1
MITDIINTNWNSAANCPHPLIPLLTPPIEIESNAHGTTINANLEATLEFIYSMLPAAVAAHTCAYDDYYVDDFCLLTQGTATICSIQSIPFPAPTLLLMSCAKNPFH